ncbi:MAG: phosphotransferase family protein [Sediminibacterium sp.]|nr:phosphotransferase family protein [Sediminibacterium sp.]
MNIEALNNIIKEHQVPIGIVASYTKYPGGFSNITYAIKTNNGNYVLRTPPPGANIKSAHDMGREYKVLQLLLPHFSKIPIPIFYSEDISVTGAPFYIMQALEGIILRAHSAPKMNITEETFRSLSEKMIDTLVALHAIDIKKTELVQLGKPEGYVTRQVEGWIKRYYASETDEIDSMNKTAEWLKQYRPIDQQPSLLHNDFKYDNVIFDTDLQNIVGVLDWEMCTVGDPLMDFGAMLAYWFEAGEGDVFTNFNLTWLPGNYKRHELIEAYAAKTGRDLSDINFYYVFGLFKNAVIAQQIYHRWKQGHSSDPRFGQLIHMVKMLGEKAVDSV